MTQPAVIILQMRTHKAGAQASLARLFSFPAFRDLNPLIVTQRQGWLSERCKENGVLNLAIPFPKSRSLQGRWIGNRKFARAVLNEVGARGFSPRLVVANDHIEALLAWQIARLARIPKVSFVRTAEMTVRDLIKYKCNTFDFLYPVGRGLSALVRKEIPGVRFREFSESVAEDDFHPEMRKSEEFPSHILVAGSEDPMKGWPDIIAAVDLLEEDSEFPALEYDFTGGTPDWFGKNHLSASRRAKLNFIGRQENFSAYVRRYGLAVHPSRMESFGLAPFEILAAGVPLLSSKAGEIDRIRSRPEWLFEPGNVQDLADKFRFLRAHWRTVTTDVAEAQQNIRRRFIFDASARLLVSDFQALMTMQPERLISDASLGQTESGAAGE